MRLSKIHHGVEIGFLKQAISSLDKVLKFCQSTQVLKEAADLVTGGGKNSSRLGRRWGNNNDKMTISPTAATIQPEAEGLLRLASDRLKTAEEDNRSVYLEDV